MVIYLKTLCFPILLDFFLNFTRKQKPKLVWSALIIFDLEYKRVYATSIFLLQLFSQSTLYKVMKILICTIL